MWATFKKIGRALSRNTAAIIRPLKVLNLAQLYSSIIMERIPTEKCKYVLSTFRLITFCYSVGQEILETLKGIIYIIFTFKYQNTSRPTQRNKLFYSR